MTRSRMTFPIATIVIALCCVAGALVLAGRVSWKEGQPASPRPRRRGGNRPIEEIVEEGGSASEIYSRLIQPTVWPDIGCVRRVRHIIKEAVDAGPPDPSRRADIAELIWAHTFAEIRGGVWEERLPELWKRAVPHALPKLLASLQRDWAFTSSMGWSMLQHLDGHSSLDGVWSDFSEQFSLESARRLPDAGSSAAQPMSDRMGDPIGRPPLGGASRGRGRLGGEPMGAVPMGRAPMVADPMSGDPMMGMGGDPMDGGQMMGGDPMGRGRIGRGRGRGAPMSGDPMASPGPSPYPHRWERAPSSPVTLWDYLEGADIRKIVLREEAHLPAKLEFIRDLSAHERWRKDALGTEKALFSLGVKMSERRLAAIGSARKVNRDVKRSMDALEFHLRGMVDEVLRVHVLRGPDDSAVSTGVARWIAWKCGVAARRLRDRSERRGFPMAMSFMGASPEAEFRQMLDALPAAWVEKYPFLAEQMERVPSSRTGGGP